MELVVWNSQGAKWDYFWNRHIHRIGPGTTDIVGLLVEAGWAPWIQSVEVTINNVYDLNRWGAKYDSDAADNSAFCQGVQASRAHRCYWVPWVKTLDAIKPNSRCSMGAVMLQGDHSLGQGHRYDFTTDIFTRPVFRFDIGKRIGTGTVPDLTVILVHLVSGYPRGAQAEIDVLADGMSKLIPQGSAGIIVGDMNIDLLTRNIRLPDDRWFILNTGAATQQSGGELDYALVYDPNRAFRGATVRVVQTYGPAAYQSDHSVLQYTIPIR